MVYVWSVIDGLQWIDGDGGFEGVVGEEDKVGLDGASGRGCSCQEGGDGEKASTEDGVHTQSSDIGMAVTPARGLGDAVCQRLQGALNVSLIRVG